MQMFDALIAHYDHQASIGQPLVPFGWNRIPVECAIELSVDGAVDGIYRLGLADDNINRNGNSMIVPVHGPRTSGNTPYLLCDYETYLLGVAVGDTEKENKRAKEKFDSEKELVFAVKEYMGESDGLKALYKFFETWDVDKAKENLAVKEYLANTKGKSMMTFYYDGHPIIADAVFVDSYNKFVEQYGVGYTMVDGVMTSGGSRVIRGQFTGEEGYEARLHNQVKLLGKSYSVFSNNNVATNYFGREQGFAFPITQLESHKIVEAFGDVFGSSRKRVRTVSDGRKKRIADAICVWSDDLPQEAEDIIAMRSLDILINGDDVPNYHAMESGNDMLDKVYSIVKKSGYVKDLDSFQQGVMVNVLEVKTRDGMGSIMPTYKRITLQELVRDIQQYYSDMELDRPNFNTPSMDYARPSIVYNSLWAKNDKGDFVAENPFMLKELMDSADYGLLYPKKAFNLILRRISVDSKKPLDNSCTITCENARYGFLKAYLIRNYGRTDITVSLNTESTNPVYIAGQVFALMESAQRVIDPNNQSTFRTRYLAQSMEDPAATFPKLHKSYMFLEKKAQQANKIGAFISYDTKISALLDKMGETYPSRLSPEQQACFLLGYHQQKTANIMNAINNSKKEEITENE